MRFFAALRMTAGGHRAFPEIGRPGHLRKAAAEPPHSKSSWRISCAVGQAGGPSARRVLVRKTVA
jgi:hypothetical protein